MKSQNTLNNWNSRVVGCEPKCQQKNSISLVISIEKKEGRKKIKIKLSFFPAQIRMLGECKLSSLVNICDFVPLGSSVENIKTSVGLADARH